PAPVEDRVGTVRVLRWLPAAASRGRVIHFHGGGYRIGCPEMEGPYASALAKACGVEVIVPQYRLAPESPFPAALNDALEVLWGTTADRPLVISGGSAGGGLAAGLALLARDEGRKVAGLVLHSPWLDLTVTAPSYWHNAESDEMFSTESAKLAAELYLQGEVPTHPAASPLMGDLAGLPPVLITAGTGEVLIDDATHFHAALQEAGVPSRLLAIDSMAHVAPTRDPAATGAGECFAAVVEFVNGLTA
ncbi:MAG: alpha/beta hydrolase fold domain-containing protein, partial [Novosphingobium sp.]